MITLKYNLNKEMFKYSNFNLINITFWLILRTEDG